ncbi:uncharacterized protein LOC113798981 [Dermatophagoides pteronyssinus]|uniref:uncharacterized protein LOC113798981 n=1 Tax=Dermatophagoides pteronyssinus TaxID=6956 RepID=UPI003F66B143
MNQHRIIIIFILLISIIFIQIMAIDDDYHSNSTTNLDKFHEKISSSNDYNEINDNDKVINNNSIMMKRILTMKQQQQRINDKKPKDKTLKTSSTTTTTTESKRMMENFLVNQRSDHHHNNNNYFTFNCQYRTMITVDNYHHLWQKIHYLNNDNNDDDDKSKKISSTSTILTLTTKNSENSNFEQLITIPMSIGNQIQYKCTMIVDHLEQCNQFYHHQRRRRQQQPQQSLIMFNRMMMMKSLNDSNGSLNLNQNQSSMNLPVHCHSIRIILKWPERIEQLSNNQDGQHSKFVVENVTKTTHITTNDDDDVEQINNSTIDDFNSYSFRKISLNNHNNQSSGKQKSITNHYEAWINITNFTIDHQGIYRMLFYRKKLNNIDSKNNTGNFSDDDDDDGHEIIYEHSFRLIALNDSESKLDHTTTIMMMNVESDSNIRTNLSSILMANRTGNEINKKIINVQQQQPNKKFTMNKTKIINTNPGYFMNRSPNSIIIIIVIIIITIIIIGLILMAILFRTIIEL